MDFLGLVRTSEWWDEDYRFKLQFFVRKYLSQLEKKYAPKNAPSDSISSRF